MLRRRTFLKVIHWTMAPLLVWFVLMTPADVVPLGLFGFHSVLALVFVIISLAWTGMLVHKGLASRPGPRLPKWAQRVHRWMHLTLIWGLFFVAFTGFLLGLTSDRLLKAGGFLPIAPPLGLSEANAIIGQIHIYEFYALALIAIGHASFHIWRHYRLKDNALRIMFPKILHRWL